MQYLSVPNLEKWQHYKDRSPPWIKLHRDMLRDYDFRKLPDAAKSHLMLLWLLASQLDNKIPNDAEYIKEQLGLKSEPEIKLLISCGFLSLLADCYQDASSVLAKCYTLCSVVETKTKTEAKTEQTNIKDILVCTDVSLSTAEPSVHTQSDSNIDKVKEPKKRASRLTEDFKPPDEWLEFARKKSLSVLEAGQEWAKFRDYHLSKGTLYLNWDAAWRTWVRNSIQFKMEKQQRESRRMT